MYRIYLLIFILFGCSSTLPDESLSLAEHLKLGMDYLDEEEFVKAQDEFKYVLSRGTGTDYGDDAQFFLAESYFLNKENINSDNTNGPTLTNDDRFGYSVENLGDLDGDGVNDLAVGAIQDDEGTGNNLGAVHIMFMNTDGSVDSTVEIND